MGQTEIEPNETKEQEEEEDCAMMEAEAPPKEADNNGMAMAALDPAAPAAALKDAESLQMEEKKQESFEDDVVFVSTIHQNRRPFPAGMQSYHRDLVTFHAAKTVRFSASDVAAMTGFHPYKNLPQLLHKLVYQGRTGEQLLHRDANALQLVLSSEEDIWMSIANKAGQTTQKALQTALRGKASKSVQQAQAVKTEVVKQAKASGKLNKMELKVLQEGTRHTVNTRFGTYHEDNALDQCEQKFGYEIYNRNAQVMEWPFQKVNSGDTPTVAPLGKARECWSSNVQNKACNPMGSSSTWEIAFGDFNAAPSQKHRIRNKRQKCESEIVDLTDTHDTNDCYNDKSRFQENSLPSGEHAMALDETKEIGSETDENHKKLASASNIQSSNDSANNMPTLPESLASQLLTTASLEERTLDETTSDAPASIPHKECAPVPSESDTTMKNAAETSAEAQLANWQSLAASLSVVPIKGMGKVAAEAHMASLQAMAAMLHDNNRHTPEEPDPFFVIRGSVDGMHDEPTFSAGAGVNGDEDWDMQPVVVELKHRMNKFFSPPPFYDQVQAVVYCFMYCVDCADLVQVLRKGHDDDNCKKEEIKAENNAEVGNNPSLKEDFSKQQPDSLRETCDSTVNGKPGTISNFFSPNKNKETQEVVPAESLIKGGALDIQNSVTDATVATTGGEIAGKAENDSEPPLQAATEKGDPDMVLTDTNYEGATAEESESDPAKDPQTIAENGSPESWARTEDATSQEWDKNNEAIADNSSQGPPRQQRQIRHRKPRPLLLQVDRISLDDPLFQHRKQWNEMLLPRLRSFADAVYTIRKDDSKRYRLLQACSDPLGQLEKDAWELLHSECPWLRNCDTAFKRN